MAADSLTHSSTASGSRSATRRLSSLLPSTSGCDLGRYAVGSTFHVSGRSLPQKTQTKSSSRTMLCSWQSGHRRNTTSWVKPEGRPSPAWSRAWATADQEVTSGSTWL